MQTKQDIERLLVAAGTQPRRRLGQHFLIDLNLMRFMVETAAVRHTDVVLEVGCGTGSLTEELLLRAGFVIGSECDPALCRILRKQLDRIPNFTLLEGDVLESKNTIAHPVLQAVEKARDQYPGKFMLVANLPYSVASSVMANLVAGPLCADAMLVTVQKEVAQRMAADPDHDDYGTLSILLSATGQVQVLKKLPPSVFWPRPQVESAIVCFRRNKKMAAQIHDMNFFRQIIQLFMGHRRKMLKACAKFADGDLAAVHNWPVVFEEAFVDPQLRPEQLAPSDYINLANLCREQTRT